MQRVGRYERIRAWSPARGGSHGPPFLLDRRWAEIRPFRDPEWWQSPAGRWRWVPELAARQRWWQRGVFAPLRAYGMGPFQFGADDVAQGATNDSGVFDTAYTFNSAGEAVGFRVVAPAASTASAVYVYLSAVTGAPAVAIELREDNGSRTGPHLTAAPKGTATLTPAAGATGWYKATLTAGGSGLSLSALTYYWVCVGVSNGAVGTSIQVRVRGGAVPSATIGERAIGLGSYLTTTGGFASGNTGTNESQFPLVILSDDGSVFGHPLATSVTPTSDTNHKGWRTGALTAPLVVLGGYQAVAAPTGGLAIFGAGTLPSDTPAATFTTGVSNVSGSVQYGFIGPAYQMPVDAGQHIVGRQATNFTVPRKSAIGTIQTGVLSELQSAFHGGSGWYYGLAAGPNTSWADDDTAQAWEMGLWVQDQVAGGGGGGGGGLRLAGPGGLAVGA